MAKKAQKKKKTAAKPAAAPQPKDFLDMVAPAAVKFNTDHAIVGGVYRSFMALRGYPSTTESLALLRHLGEKSGVSLSIYTRQVTAAEEKQIIQNASSKNWMALNSSNDLRQSVAARANLQDVEEMVTTMEREHEPLHHCAVFIGLTAKDADSLRTLRDQVTAELIRAKLSADPLLLRQREGFMASNPAGFNAFGAQYERVLPASSVANLYPFNYSGKTDPQGFYVGRDRYGSNIIVDLDRRAEDKTTASVLILGNSGQGKSYLLKLLLCNILESGKSAICLDPEHELMLDRLIDQLPDRVCDQVSREIWEDDRRQREATEAARRISVFRVTQDGETDCLLTEGAASMDAFHAALRLRSYLLAKSNSSQRFIQTIPAAEHIAPEVFQDYAGEFRQGAGRVTAVLDIDLDHGKFSTLSAQNVWETYTTRDVSTAAWRASQKDGLRWERRLEVFAAHLEDKEITPEHRLDVSRITFADEIMEMDGLLNFYVAIDFDPDHAFGTNVCTDENDDWVNVYANYDMSKGQVCGALEINLCRGDGTEKTMRYPLTPAEKKVLAGKMETFCQEVTGQSLKDYCAQLQAEDMEPAAGQTMG